MGTSRGRGLRRKPEGGWPLDDILVGVATLRTIRELFRQNDETPLSRPRAWDLALWSGVTPQGSANSLERLERAELVRALAPERPWRAPGYSLELSHPLTTPMMGLLEAERSMIHRRRRRRRAERRVAAGQLGGELRGKGDHESDRRERGRP